MTRRQSDPRRHALPVAMQRRRRVSNLESTISRAHPSAPSHPGLRPEDPYHPMDAAPMPAATGASSPKSLTKQRSNPIRLQRGRRRPLLQQFIQAIRSDGYPNCCASYMKSKKIDPNALSPTLNIMHRSGIPRHRTCQVPGSSIHIEWPPYRLFP